MGALVSSRAVKTPLLLTPSCPSWSRYSLSPCPVSGPKTRCPSRQEHQGNPWRPPRLYLRFRLGPTPTWTVPQLHSEHLYNRLPKCLSGTSGLGGIVSPIEDQSHVTLSPDMDSVVRVMPRLFSNHPSAPPHMDIQQSSTHNLLQFIFAWQQSRSIQRRWHNPPQKTFGHNWRAARRHREWDR